MTRFKLNRRTVIKGAGTIAIALPWLEVMGHGRRARAQTAPCAAEAVRDRVSAGRRRSQRRQRRQVHADRQRDLVHAVADPRAAAADAESAHRRRRAQPDLRRSIQVLRRAAPGRLGRPAHRGDSEGSGNYSAKMYPSIDQVLAPRLSVGKAYGSLQFAVRWATGKSHGKISPMNAMYFSDSAPIPPRLDPQDIFKTLFGSPTGGTGGTGGTDANASAMRRKSILDFVDKEYQALKAKLGTDDRARLDQHLTQIRDLESAHVIITTPPTPTGQPASHRRRWTPRATTQRARSIPRTTAASRTSRPT